MKPEVSIIIPAYNCEEYLARALESVFAQTYSNFEVIVIDDASQDSTLDVARSFDDPRLTIIANPQNEGVSSVRNYGIKQATGQWIALLDSDDWYAVDRLEKLLEAAVDRDADLIADDLFLIRDREQYPWSTLLQENQPRHNRVELIDATRFIASDRPNPINARRSWSFGYTKPLIRKEFLLEHNITYDENIKVGEDFILYLECLFKKARFVLVPRPYYYYRTLEISLSTRKPTEYLAQSCQITQRFIDSALAENQRDNRAIAALNQNLKIFDKRLSYYRAVEHIKQKKPLHTLVQIIRCPYILIYFTNKLITILEYKTLANSPAQDSEYINLTFD